jgi:hypothetical protein
MTVSFSTLDYCPRHIQTETLTLLAGGASHQVTAGGVVFRANADRRTLASSWPGIAVQRTASLRSPTSRPSTSFFSDRFKSWMPGPSQTKSGHDGRGIVAHRQRGVKLIFTEVTSSFRKPRSGYPESITTAGAELARPVAMDCGFAGLRPRPGMTATATGPRPSALPAPSGVRSRDRRRP